jgi:chemotaxis signal transduction protein
MSAAPVTCLNLLLFSVGGVRFGIEADQAESIAAYTGETGNDLFRFHDVVNYGDDSITYASPTIITVRTRGFRPCRVIIDSMEDIAEFSQNDIRPFPPLLEPLALRKGMWGILVRNGSMVLLVDFQRLTIEAQADGI